MASPEGLYASWKGIPAINSQPDFPRLSVIIPNYNGRQYLAVCLASLRGQTYPNLETIVVDNASTDDSVSYIQREFPEVKLLALEVNLGLAGGINYALQTAEGEYLAALNNDTEADKGWAAALVDALRDHPDAGMVASKMLLFDRRDTFHAAGDGFYSNGLPFNRGVWQKDRGQYDRREYVFGACGGAAAYRREMIARIGFFDEDLFMYCEDVDLNWRAQIAGYKCLYVPEAVVYHCLSATGGGVIASFYTGRNTILNLVKNFPAALWRKHWTEILRAQGRISWEALRAWRGPAARARLRGQLAALLLIPKWLRKRSAVQRLTAVSDDDLAALLSPTETAQDDRHA
jgi:GT2 family glycosyltransferase